MPIHKRAALKSWAGTSTFFWAGTAATVGLGNLWQFPWLAGQHGGGYFVLMYLACLLLITMPLMLAETTLGLRSRHGIVLAMEGMARGSGLSRHWVWLGRLSILAGFLVLSITLVIGAICLAFVFDAALGSFRGASEVGLVRLLNGLVEDPHEYRDFMAWHGFMILLVGAVAVQGAIRGFERALRLAVPALLLLLVLLLGIALVHGDPETALERIAGLRPDDVSWPGLRAALIHAFYTVGLGLGVWAAFGAHMAMGTPLKRSVLAIVLTDTLIALMAGVVLYGFVLGAQGDGTEKGFALVFVALPLSLSQVAGGQIPATLVFMAIVLVAWTSSMALLAAVAGWFREWTGAPLRWSVTLVLVGAWVAGLATLFSFNVWSELTFLGATVFRWLELVSSGLLIPLVSIALALFLGWWVKPAFLFGLLGRTPRPVFLAWFWMLRLALPLVVVFVAISHGASSVRQLCDSGEVVWCEQDLEEMLLPGPRVLELSPSPPTRKILDDGRVAAPMLTEQSEPASATGRGQNTPSAPVRGE